MLEGLFDLALFGFLVFLADMSLTLLFFLALGALWGIWMLGDISVRWIKQRFS